MSDNKTYGAIDCSMTPNPSSGLGRSAPADYLHNSDAERERLVKGVSADELVAEMDQAGVERGIIDTNHALLNTDEERASVRQIVEKYPSRFISALNISPHGGMDALREMEERVRRDGVQTIRMEPWLIQRPPNDKIYYPFYSKAVELDLVVQVNVGFPGPRSPAWLQDPLHLDEVCYFFPELKLMMTHLGDPWIGTVIKILIRWENAYLLTDAVAPKYYPSSLIQYMNSRGSRKVLFGSEYPFLPLSRCMAEIGQLPLKPEVRRNFLHDNALRLFTWPGGDSAVAESQ